MGNLKNTRLGEVCLNEMLSFWAQNMEKECKKLQNTCLERDALDIARLRENNMEEWSRFPWFVAS